VSTGGIGADVFDSCAGRFAMVVSSSGVHHDLAVIPRDPSLAHRNGVDNAEAPGRHADVKVTLTAALVSRQP
jgi:hypothetical protein